MVTIRKPKKTFLLNKGELLKPAKRIAEKQFIGGPLQSFEDVGRLQLITLLRLGLYPYSKVLDVGCGALRGGYWLIRFLNRGCYFGIEPNKEMLETSIDELLTPELFDEKRPQFSHNDDFDFSVFNEKFDFVVARSVWTHASKYQIKTMLNSFIDNSEEDAIFLTSYKRAGFFDKDYKGITWVGKSHKSNKSGIVLHSFKWIKKECEKKSLVVKELNEDFYNQRWLYIYKGGVYDA